MLSNGLDCRSNLGTFTSRSVEDFSVKAKSERIDAVDDQRRMTFWTTVAHYAPSTKTADVAGSSLCEQLPGANDAGDGDTEPTPFMADVSELEVRERCDVKSAETRKSRGHFLSKI